MKQDEVGKAKSEAVRAREELGRAGDLKAHSQRLAALEAAVSARGEELQWSQRAFEELDSATRSLHLAKVPPVGPMHFGAQECVFTSCHLLTRSFWSLTGWGQAKQRADC